MMKAILSLLLLLSCGFTSSLYEDIIAAQEMTKSQEYTRAAILYEQILEKKPSRELRIKIGFQLGKIYAIYLNKPAEAIEAYKTAIKTTQDPSLQVSALEKIAEIYFKDLRNYEAAIKNYTKLKNFTPKLKNHDEYEFQIARSYYNKKDYTRAEQYFSKFKTNTQFYETYNYLGLIHFYQSEWEQAISNWFEYIKREPKKHRVIQAKFLIANAYESKEDLKKAYNIYYSLLGEYPNQEVLKKRLKAVYNRRVARKR